MVFIWNSRERNSTFVFDGIFKEGDKKCLPSDREFNIHSLHGSFINDVTHKFLDPLPSKAVTSLIYYPLGTTIVDRSADCQSDHCVQAINWKNNHIISLAHIMIVHLGINYQAKEIRYRV